MSHGLLIRLLSFSIRSDLLMRLSTLRLSEYFILVMVLVFFFFSTLLYLIHFHILNLLPCFIRLLFLSLILFFSLWVLFCLLWTVWTTSSKLFLYNLWLEILSCSQESHDFGNGNSFKKKIRLTYLFPLMLDTSLWIFLIKLSFSSF